MVGASFVLRYNSCFTTKWAGIYRPFFLVVTFLMPVRLRSRSKSLGPGKKLGLQGEMGLHEVVEQAVSGLGFELVDIERTGGGLLRLTIDWPWDGTERFINAEDCERVTRQLQFVLEVEGVDYARLEVSSPGIDRPLKGVKDFERFAGQLIDLTLKVPIGAQAALGVAANRKKFRGLLEQTDTGWQVSWSDEPQPKPGQKVSRKKVPAPLLALGFVLEDVAQARLAPVVDFKGRKPKAPEVNEELESRGKAGV
jgi:ribosome maturation factor RimP